MICLKYKKINIEWLISGTGYILKSNSSFIKLKENTKVIPFEPFCKISSFVIDALTSDNFESNFLIIPEFNEANYLTEVKSLALFRILNSGDVVACKRINLFNLFFKWIKFLIEYIL